MLSVFFAATVSGTARAQYFSLRTQDSLVQVLMNRHIALGNARQSMAGYRVQIFFGGQRTDANQIKSEFSRMYPLINAYISYQQPNFKVRVGDFKTRLEAMKFLKQIHPLYTTAFIVKDDVRLPDLP